MNFASWGIPDWTVQAWGITPVSLVAPFALLVMMLMMRRVIRAAGPKTETRDFASAALIFVIIGAAFLWIFAGLGLIARIFH
jgi:hypothetical protein